MTTNPALLVIDMQNGFCSSRGSFARSGASIGAYGAIIPEVGELCAAARSAGVQVIYTRHVYRAGYLDAGIDMEHVHPRVIAERGLVNGEWDAEIVRELAPHEQDVVIEKKRYDSFLWTDLDLILRRLRVEHLTFAGVSTNVCVESTARTAAQLGYKVFVTIDATAATSRELHESAIRSLQYGFGMTGAWREIAATWDRSAVELPLNPEGVMPTDVVED